MEATVAVAVALNKFGRKSEYLREHWATQAFRGSFQLAMQLAQEKAGKSLYLTGATLEWSPSRTPESVMVAIDTGYVASRDLITLPLDGELLKTMCRELRAVAEQEALKQVKEEFELEQRKKAANRVFQALSTADTPSDN